MTLYEVVREFRDVDKEVKQVGQIIVLEPDRAAKLVTSGFVVPIPRELIDTMLKTINDQVVVTDGKVDTVTAETISNGNSLGVVDDKLGESDQLWGANGNKTALAYANAAYQHIHMQAKCYPTLAAGVQVTAAAGAWNLGAFAVIVPADTLVTAFDIHYVNFEAASANNVYELVLYGGADTEEVEIGRIRSDRQSNQAGITNVPIQIPVQHANGQIKAKLASSSGGNNVTVSVFYHEYE